MARYAIREKKIGQVRDPKPVRPTSPSGSRTRRVPKIVGANWKVGAKDLESKDHCSPVQPSRVYIKLIHPTSVCSFSVVYLVFKFQAFIFHGP